LVRFGKLVDRRGQHIGNNTMTGVSKDYLLITEAAEFLQVAPNTLRSWGSQGKIEEFRHPVNNYRLYRKSDLQRLQKMLHRPRRAK
jgi:hypothetical protein